MSRGRSAGRVLPMETPPHASEAPVAIPTEEAVVVAPRGCDLRLDPETAEDRVLAEGAPLARLRPAAGIRLVAPMACRVARIRAAEEQARIESLMRGIPGMAELLEQSGGTLDTVVIDLERGRATCASRWRAGLGRASWRSTGSPGPRARRTP